MSDFPIRQHQEVRVLPKDEETIEGWQAFSVTAVKPDGHVVRWSLYERSPDPNRGAWRVNRGPVPRTA